MEPAAYAKIRRNPKFVELVSQRNRLARILTIAMLVIYFGFILLVAYAPELPGHADGSGSSRPSAFRSACSSSSRPSS